MLMITKMVALQNSYFCWTNSAPFVYLLMEIMHRNMSANYVVINLWSLLAVLYTLKCVL